MWCEVVCREGVDKYPHILKELMRSENFDAKTALAEDEVSLFSEVFQILQKEISTRVGEREYDAVLRIVATTPGNQFTPKDVECRYNLAKVVGKCHVDFLVSFCSSYVDFKHITVSNKCMQALTKLPDGCTWLKIFLLVDLYMTLEPKVTVSGKGLADNWNKGHIDDLMETFPAAEFTAMEEISRKFMNTYNETHLCDVATELIHKTQCRFASKAGAIIRDKKRAEWRK
jgi:hypothetical protein